MNCNQNIYRAGHFSVKKYNCQCSLVDKRYNRDTVDKSYLGHFWAAISCFLSANTYCTIDSFAIANSGPYIVPTDLMFGL